MGSRFIFELHEHGWATVGFEIGGKQFEWTASRMSDDALGDMMLAFAALLTGGAAETRTVFVSAPLCLAITLADEGEGRVRVTATEFPDWPPTSRSVGRVLFDASARLRTLAGSVLSVGTELIRTWGEDGYLANWRTPFPASALERLRVALAERLSVDRPSEISG